MSRPVVATAVLAFLALGGCEEKRTVYRDARYPVYRDGVRDSDVYAGRGRVVCDPNDKLCYKNGRPSKDATQDMYGKRATRHWWD